MLIYHLQFLHLTHRSSTKCKLLKTLFLTWCHTDWFLKWDKEFTPTVTATLWCATCFNGGHFAIQLKQFILTQMYCNLKHYSECWFPWTVSWCIHKIDSNITVTQYQKCLTEAKSFGSEFITDEGRWQMRDNENYGKAPYMLETWETINKKN